MPWRLAILDEAQAIKNPGAKQTRAVKQLDARARIALTGTPVENRLGDLWSIFDFLNPGLLGSAKAFSTFTKRLVVAAAQSYAPLRELVRPYILRRLKTDTSVIADLPDKTEVKAFCHLTRKQAALYQQAVEDLAAELAPAEGMKRRGVVLASSDAPQADLQSPVAVAGRRLVDARPTAASWRGCGRSPRSIAAKQEKVLVFTQFREMTAPLAAFLESVFGRPGLVLHGETAVAKRQPLVQQFQEDERVPFFVLSLKAGGAGLNLTAASHVVHFDRWWNPAVENQATDRAFRIGQTKNVLVHKFVCRGTVEERIDQLIDSKRQLSRGSARRRRRGAADRDDRRRAAEARRARPPHRVRGVRMDYYDYGFEILRLGRAPDGLRPRASWRSSRRRAARSRRSRSRGARSPGRSGAKRGATTSSATATSRTGCRAGGPTCATDRCVDLQVAPGRVTALVSGSTMYEVTVVVGALPRARWSAICADCSGAIDSLVELLQGRFSKGVMTRICEEKTGLFPSPQGHPVHLQLSGLGVDVQARRGGAVRHRRAAGPAAGAALHASRDQQARPGRERRNAFVEGAETASRLEGPRLSTISRRCSASTWRQRTHHYQRSRRRLALPLPPSAGVGRRRRSP